MMIGCVWVTNVRIIDTMPSYKNSEKVWGWLSGAQHTAQRKDFELILKAKMETIHPVEGPFGREVLALVIIAEL